MYKILKNTIEMDDYSVQKLSNQPPEPFEWNTVEGTELNVSDCIGGKGKIEVKGSTYQKQLDGNQLIDFSKPSTGQNVSASFENDIFTVTSSTGTYRSCYFIITNLYKENPGKVLRFAFEQIVASVSSGSKVQINLRKTDDSMQYITLVNSSLVNFSHTISDDTSDIASATLTIYTNNTNTSIDNASISITKPMLQFGTEDKDYEPYCGGQPSPNPDYPQNIEVVTGDNVVKHIGKNVVNLNNRIKTVASGVTLVADSVQPNSFRMGGKATWGNYVFMFNNNKPNTDYGIRARFRSTVATTIRLSVYGTNVLNYTTSDLTNLGQSENTSLPANTDVDLSATFNSGSYQYLVIRFWNNATGTALSEITDLLIDNIQLEEGTVTPYEPYREEEYELSLGNIELCKIGDYQDILFKNVVGDENYNAELEEEAWYKKKIINKFKVKYSDFSNIQSINPNGYVNFRFIVSNIPSWINNGTERRKSFCNFFKFDTSLIATAKREGYNLSDDRTLYIRISQDRFSTAEELEQFLDEYDVEIYCILNDIAYEKIINPTLISQLEALRKAKWFKGVNHWWTETNNLDPVLKGTYKQAINE